MGSLNFTDTADVTLAQFLAGTLPAGAATSAKQDTGNTSLTQLTSPTFRSEVTLTRPNDSTPYSINDAVTDSTSASTAIDFANCARSAGTGVTLLQARMTINKVMGSTRFRLWLYRDTPASIPNDNAAFSQTWANSSLRIGYVDFATPITGSDCSDYYGTPVWTGAHAVQPVGTSIKGILQVLDAVTPAALDQYKFVLGGYRD